MNSHKDTTKFVNDFLKAEGQEEGLFKFKICEPFLQEDGFKSSKSRAFVTCSSVAGHHCLCCAEDKLGIVITSNLHLIILKRYLNKEHCLKTKPVNDSFLIKDGTSQVGRDLSAIFTYRPNNPRDATGSHVYKTIRLCNFYAIPQKCVKQILASISVFLSVRPFIRPHVKLGFL